MRQVAKRLREIGFPEEYGPYKSRRGQAQNYIGGYDELTDSFLLFQDTGVAGGSAHRWVKARTFAKNYYPFW